MELVKLCFIAHGFWLAKYNQPLFDDNERIEAWPYGPVPINIYRDFRSQGITISQKSKSVNQDINLSEERNKYIKEIIEHYSKFNPFVLSDVVLEEGSPWVEIVKKQGFYNEIPNKLIRNYYKSL